jgi:ABC-type polysaccharide/polyol phosphate transport system ATPase subunit
MASLQLDDVSLRYPIFSPRSQSIKTLLLTKLGGAVSSHNNTVVIEALRNVSLQLNDGDRLGIVGHNGAGKTTLLRVMSQVYEPQQGKVNIEGSLCCFVDIIQGMDTEANGWDNIIFRGVFLGLTFEQAKALSPSIAEFSELGEYLNMPVRTYSSGMFMRLAFAITTSVYPEIILMDEMIGAGDASFYDKTISRVTQMVDRTKIVVVATHSNFIISKFCNKIVWLEKGRVKDFGSVDTILPKFEAS